MNKCKICGKPTKIISKQKGYRPFCSPQCSNSDPDKKLKAKQTCNIKYGGNSSACSPEITAKRKQTNILKYGVSDINILKTTKIKKAQTCMKLYGVPCPMQNESVKHKYKINFFQKYGVENPLQVSDMYYKNIISSFKSKKYILPSGRIIHKQGYEPQFLDYVFNNKILDENDIVYYPISISYINIYNLKSRYYPDFYIPKYNLIIEIKSKYTVEKDKNMFLKEIAALNAGFKYIRIVDNNFSGLLNIVH